MRGRRGEREQGEGEEEKRGWREEDRLINKIVLFALVLFLFCLYIIDTSVD